LERELMSADEAVELKEIMCSLAELPPIHPSVSEAIIDERQTGP
jgi:hypothetical protein